MNDVEMGAFERALEIDRDNLDRCLIEQPAAYQRVAEAYARAVSERDGEKDAVKQEEGRAYLAILDEAADKGEKKPTEGTVAAQVALDSAVMALRKKLNAANANVEALDGLREAFRERAYVLRELAQLWSSGYWQDASTRGQASRDVGDAALARRRAAMQETREARVAARPPGDNGPLPRRRINV